VSTRATIRDVADRAGVSVATVSRVMNEKGDVSDETREKVRAAATALGYLSASTARALVAQRTRLVAVVVGDNSGHRDLSMMFFSKVIGAISRRLTHSHYEPLLLVDDESEIAPGDAILEHQFDAAIIIGVDDDDPLIDSLAARRVPLVGIDVRCGGPHTAFVGSDHADGVRLALGHLYALGHRRIAHIAGAANTVSGRERLAAFQTEADRLGLDVPGDYVRAADFSSASGYAEACAVLALATPPTAIVVASDLMALATLQAIRDFGLTPGSDVSVVGFDDLEPASLAHPPLTTIRQDRGALGTLAATRAIEMIEHPEAPSRGAVVPVELVVRASSSAPAREQRP
jgi:LacI family transcriptional regulator